MDKSLREPATTQHEALKRRESNTLNVNEMKNYWIQIPCPFNIVFELKSSNESPFLTKTSICDFRNPALLEIASYAASMGHILNISDVPTWLSNYYFFFQRSNS